MIKHEPDYFGKKGFTRKQSLGRKLNAVNVGELEKLADTLAAEEMVEKKGGKVLLDLDKLGYDKLLGKGKIAIPVLISVASYSELAAKKIENSGGRILEEPEVSS